MAHRRSGISCASDLKSWVGAIVTSVFDRGLPRVLTFNDSSERWLPHRRDSEQFGASVCTNREWSELQTREVFIICPSLS
jgi:hypothetical protein